MALSGLVVDCRREASVGIVSQCERIYWHGRSRRLLCWQRLHMFRLNAHSLRLLTLLLSVLALTTQGFAAALHFRSCQAQMVDVRSEGVHAKAADVTALPDDCCLVRDGQKGTCELPGKGKLPGNGDSCSWCKVGFNCKSPQPSESHALLISVVPIVQLAVSAPSVALLSYRSPDGLWRPPTLI